MNTKSLFGFVAIASAGLAVSAGGYFAGRMPVATAAEATGGETAVAETPAGNVNKEQVEKIVREYLLANPEILIDVQTALQTKQEEKTRLAQAATLKDAADSIFKQAEDSVLGNPDGDVTVVEFFDYNCGYCRRAVEDMDALIKSDPNVRFVLKELPILGPDSVKAHIVAQSFKKLMPEKYGEFHRSLLGSGHADEDSAIALAKSLGADEAALRKGMEAPEIGKHFELNSSLAQSLDINGTPAYVIKDLIVPGALGFETLSEKVTNVRKCNSANC